MRNHGRTMAISMMAPRIVPKVAQNMRMASPSVLSMVSMSFEKRFMIRPRG